uniref:Uncharacterized protein n=1 Tax=Siphoviridae sp. cthu813 TaxID=2825618 RepID=A0A8S5VHX7_9CAUD|nr:MAG TPA: hypothetical protein [Siphoviridae sp. cthu813]
MIVDEHQNVVNTSKNVHKISSLISNSGLISSIRHYCLIDDSTGCVFSTRFFQITKCNRHNRYRHTEKCNQDCCIRIKEIRYFTEYQYLDRYKKSPCQKNLTGRNLFLIMFLFYPHFESRASVIVGHAVDLYFGNFHAITSSQPLGYADGDHTLLPIVERYTLPPSVQQSPLL